MGLDPYTFANSEGTLTMTWAPHEDEPLRVARDLERAAAALEDEYKMLLAAREVVVFDVKSHFASETGPEGGWPPRSSARASEKFYQSSTEDLPLGISAASSLEELRGAGLAVGFGGPLLVKTGAGKAVATARSSFVVEASSLGGTITFSATPPEYMLEHNKGLPERETHGGFWEGPNPLPQREWMWLSEGAGEAIFQIFEDFVDDAVALVTSPLTGVTSVRTTGGFFQNPHQLYMP